MVTFNSAHIVAATLGRLDGAARVVLVDNGSDDDTCALAEAARPGIEIIRNPVNRGHGAAANQGFARVDTEFGLLHNLDAGIDGTALAQLVERADANPGAGIVAPVLANSHGRPEISFMGPNETRHHQVDFIPDGDFCTWFTTGAIWLVRMAAWRDVGGFDETFFLYSDDVDLCLEMARAGYHLIVVPDARAHHEGGRSVPATREIQLLKDWHQTWSHLHLTAKHGDPERTRASARALYARCRRKALMYRCLLRFDRARGNQVKADAAKAYLDGRPSRPPGA